MKGKVAIVDYLPIHHCQTTKQPPICQCFSIYQSNVRQHLLGTNWLLNCINFLKCPANSDEPSTSAAIETTPTTKLTGNAEREQPVAESLPAVEPEAITAVELEDQQGDDSPSKAKRKNRCTTCRKKVGLTGEHFKNAC